MLLRCTFEELRALDATASRVMLAVGESRSHVAAPPEAVADVAHLQPQLTGDISFETYEEQQVVARAVDYLLDELRDRMHETVLAQHVGAEDAVNAYFDYANVYTLRERLRGIGREMVAMIELMTGEPPTPETSRAVTFPDD